MAATNSSTSTGSPSIDAKGLSYKFQDGSYGLVDINLSLPAGSRTLLIGGRRDPVFLSFLDYSLVI